MNGVDEVNNGRAEGAVGVEGAIDPRERPFVIQFNGGPIVLFYGHSPKRSNRFFSNFAPSDFTVDTNTIRGACDLGVFNGPVMLHWSEQYLMLGKALLFGDAASAVKIITARSPDVVKALGRKVAGFNEEVWERERSNIMVAGLMLKFGAEPLRSYLLETGDALMVECSPTDKIWGVGLKIGDLGAFRPETWKGKNLLGLALMEARKRLRGG